MRRTILLILALAAAACGGSPPGTAPRPRVDPNEISEAEVRASTQVNAYDLVMTLRPNWLNRQITPTSVRDPEQDQPVVYLNGQRYGTLPQLRSIRTVEVARVRWYSAVAAQQQFGRATGGVVEVISRAGP